MLLDVPCDARCCCSVSKHNVLSLHFLSIALCYVTLVYQLVRSRPLAHLPEWCVYTSVAAVKFDDNVAEALADVRNDGTETGW